MTNDDTQAAPTTVLDSNATDPLPPEVPSIPPEPVIAPAEAQEPKPETPPATLQPVPESAKPLPASAGTKKTGMKGGVLAIIITLLFTLPVAVYFISQQNRKVAELRGKAYAGCSGNTPSLGCEFGTWYCNNGSYACDMGGTITGSCPNPNVIGGGDPCTLNGVSVNCSVVHMIRCNCGGNVWVAGQETSTCDSLCSGIGFPCDTTCGDDGPADDDTSIPTPTPTVPGPTATPTTGTAPVCQNIKIYKGNAQVTNPSTLRPGDVVTLAVKGNLSPTKAHFRVNGGSWTETTTKNAANEHTLSYTIPEGVTDFVIEGEVFTNGAWH